MIDRETRLGLTFLEWKAAVNRELARATSLVADDLPDWDYWCAWDAGMGAIDAAKEVLSDLGYSIESDRPIDSDD